MIKLVQSLKHWDFASKGSETIINQNKLPEVMQVIFTKWHMITLDVEPLLINIFLQKKRFLTFLYININICTDYQISLQISNIAHNPSLPCLVDKVLLWIMSTYVCYMPINTSKIHSIQGPLQLVTFLYV